jgi:hypothetical protein
VQQARHGAALKLAVGGPRESEAPGIYRRAAAFIRELMDSVGEGGQTPPDRAMKRRA